MSAVKFRSASVRGRDGGVSVSKNRKSEPIIGDVAASAIGQWSTGSQFTRLFVNSQKIRRYGLSFNAGAVYPDFSAKYKKKLASRP